MRPIEPAAFPWKDFRRYTYPLGLDLGDCAFLSGMTSSTFDAELNKVVAKGSLQEQVSTVSAKIRTVLSAAGYGSRDIVSLVQYVPTAALGSLAEMDELLRDGGLGEAPKHVVPVARLLRGDALLEVEVVAARRPERIGECVRFRSSGDATAVVFAGHANGTLAQQIETLSRALSASGSDWSRTARCRVFVATDASDVLAKASEEVSVRIPELKGVPAVGVPTLPPGYDGVQLAIEWLAPTQPLRPSLLQLYPAEAPQRVASGVARRVGSLLVATGLQADSGAGDIQAQARALYGEVIPSLLAAHGAAMSQLVQTVEWLPRDALSEYRPTAEIRRRLLSEPFPVASGLVCSVLPANAKLAVDVVAYLPLASGV